MILKVTFGKKTHLINIADKPTISQLKNSIHHIFKSLPARYTLSYFDEDGDEITLQDQQDYQILLSSNSKSAKVNIKEVNEQFMEFTQKIEIEEQISEIREKVQDLRLEEPKQQVEPPKEPIVPEVDQSLIEERLKKMLPDIISKVKSQISEELSERSRISNQPLITEDNIQEQIPKSFEKTKIEEPTRQSIVIHKGVTCDNCGKKDITGARYKCSVCSNFDFCEECEATFQHAHPFLKIKTPRQAPLKIFTVVNDQENNIEINGHRINAPPGFEGLVHHGLNFFQNMLQRRGGRHHRARQEGTNTQGGCPFRRNCRRNPTEETQMKPQNTKTEEKVPEKKMQEKQQPKQAFLEGNEEEILNNAQYLSSFGFEFDKCFQWAKTYPRLSRENLLQFCLNQPGFLN